MRLILFTGKGGVGKTTIAAATAVLAATRGAKTLLVSTDPAHSVADALAVPVAGGPTEIDTGLYALQVDAQRRFEESWRVLTRYLHQVFDAAGVDPIAAEELTVLPGAEELLALLEVREQAAGGRWDVMVVDCAPTAETLRLLALPEALGFYLDRLLPLQRRFLRSLRPALSRGSGVPAPGNDVLGAVGRLTDQLREARRVLTDPGASVRLVLTPEAVVLAEARRALTTLSLYGYRVDAVVANRVFPAGDGDGWRAGWVAAQQAQLAEAVASFAPLPVHTSLYRAAEPVGLSELGALARQTYAGGDPLALPEGPEPVQVVRDGTEFDLRIALPHARREEVDLARRGEELIVTAGGYRRVLALPSVLRRCEVTGANLSGGMLRIGFRPDPAQWPAQP